MNADWKFHDDPDTACFTTSFVLDGSPILRVYHDYEGDWQFHGSPDQPADSSVARIVGLAEVVGRDPALSELHDLPCGWRAERDTTSHPWTRHKDHPFPTFSEDGYYLEDAVWLSESLPDITPPDAETRSNLFNGQYVKLVFRFAQEDSLREDNQCERMWVQVTGLDDDDNYVGTIENDPHHESAKYGDVISFHPLHVADISTED
jgi:hypothetical protein